MFRLLIVAAALLLLATDASAHGSEAAAPPPPPKDVPPPVTLGKTRKGPVLADTNGMTLYYFDRDDSGNKSNCDGKCAEKWIPLAADKNAQASGGGALLLEENYTMSLAEPTSPPLRSSGAM